MLTNTPNQPTTAHATEDWLNTVQGWSEQLRQTLPWLQRASAGASLGFGLGRDIVGLTESLHGTIAGARHPFKSAPAQRTRGLTGLVYRCVHQGFASTEQALATISQQFPQPAQASDPLHWQHVHAALNGVLGDRLHARGNALAQGMTLIPAHGEGSEAQGDRPRWIFVHGLCMHEGGWQRSAHQGFIDELQNSAVASSYLRYNTGRHISENGWDFHLQMQNAWEQGQRSPLWLVGHSMGGLVIRSAMAQAQAIDADWLNRVQAAAYLGSPHHGSPLEVWGNHANRLLGITAYTAPFMRLGGVRSAGIQDLRHGNLMHADWQSRESDDDTRDLRQPCPLLPDIPHLLIAARRQGELQGLAGDDYLVPVRSALAEHAQHRVHAPRIVRQVVEERHHMDLLGDPQVYAALQGLLR